ncbi:hypothetical protein GCM10011531_27990 [Aquaticitalea lipolytica]|jgi:hypothetical protein|uniref:Uncharacterized protein n=1 Tax=Aquaticitalea lipolytica TaxID=1247562 RepID=A0A8J2TSU9_9FLAO|nr:hypothetical protein [Aquaticitalea lipolytica]GFZ94650.1 hypothetical protein GCM10011531_27990 [Aquaticitalea lipolytica]
MLNVIIAIVIVILLTIGLVWVIDKFVPKKLKPVLNIALWLLIIFLGYKTYMSVYGEIQFNQLKEKRYALVIEKLKDIRDAELAHRTVTGQFTDSFDGLIKFVENGKFTITQRRTETVKDEALSRSFGVDMFKEIVVIDTLGFVSVKDSLFKNSDRYKTMMDVPVGEPGTKFTLKAGKLDDIPVFEASVEKAKLLFDQDKNLVDKENQVISVDGVNGPTLKVGSMDEVNTNGNWPKNYSKEQ